MKKYVGVFDSGLGGLTAVKEMMAQLPCEPVVYFGDTGRVPYGSKSDEIIIKYAKSDVKFLNTFPLKMIVAACGTVSTIALPYLKQHSDIPIVGVVEAAAHAAVKCTKNKKVGIIGTMGSIRSGAYETYIRAENEEIQTFSRACPLFVPLVEEGYTKGKIARAVCEEYLLPMRETGVDTLILGCTHYPHLYEEIAAVMGEHVTLIDPAKETVAQVRHYLTAQNLLWNKEGEYRFYVSDTPRDFETLGSRFLGREIPGGAEKIEIEKFTE